MDERGAEMGNVDTADSGIFGGCLVHLALFLASASTRTQPRRKDLRGIGSHCPIFRHCRFTDGVQPERTPFVKEQDGKSLWEFENGFILHCAAAILMIILEISDCF